ncbi:GNAT family N-acetyltransferase [Kitasatospora sp. NPDC002227]|uniref:GNAT family N-acetyltransferase n=1 Tax=Kitasatospora sp. NPDC002227 TaxID=3154773 RepID=UPI003316F6E0
MDDVLELRPAVAAEAAEISMLLARAWRENYAEFLGGYRTERLIARYCTVERISAEIGATGAGDGWLGWVIARADGELAGAGAGGITTVGSGEVYTLCTSGKHGHLDVGGALMRAVTRQQLERGAEQQWVAVYGENDPMYPFFVSHGFAPEQAAAPAAEEEDGPGLLRLHRTVRDTAGSRT